MLVQAQAQPCSETGDAMRCDVTQRSGLHPCGGFPVPARSLSSLYTYDTVLQHEGIPPPMNLVGICTQWVSVFRHGTRSLYPPVLPAWGRVRLLLDWTASPKDPCRRRGLPSKRSSNHPLLAPTALLVNLDDIPTHSLALLAASASMGILRCCSDTWAKSAAAPRLSRLFLQLSFRRGFQTVPLYPLAGLGLLSWSVLVS